MSKAKRMTQRGLRRQVILWKLQRARAKARPDRQHPRHHTNGR